MPAPLHHVNVGQMMGSWPFIPSSIGPGVTLQSRSLQPSATILGSRRETGSGYSVVGLSFYLWVDNISGVPVQHSISFTDPGPGYLTLDNVVSQINSSAVPALPGTVAFKDNGFLRLKSPFTGEKSYLRLERDAASTTAVFVELGLFAEIEARGGDLERTPALDPDRQPPLPNQLSWGEGEQFEARVFNRVAFQLAVNADRAYGILDLKRVATRTEHIESSYVVQSPSDEGLQLSGFVYMGNDGATPSITQLEKHFAVLDGSGREFMKEMEDVLASQSVGTRTLARLENGDVTITTTMTFPASDADEEVFVRIATVPGFSALDGKLLKITYANGTGTATIQPVDPVTGNYITIGPDNDYTEIAITTLVERVRIYNLRCEVDGVYDTQGGSRKEGVLQTKHASVTVSRVELNNRVFCSGATFVSGASPVVAGDRVVWANHSIVAPYTNNATYRVASIIDDETLELVAEDWGPVFLNMDVSGGGLGDITVTTDGQFWDSPFIRFNPNGGLPEAGDYVKVVYRGLSSIRAATDDPAVLDAGSLIYNQEADDTVQRAIMKILGPGVSSIDDYVRAGESNINLEQLDIRLDKEHYDETGRHSTIYPDKIDMQVEVSGKRAIIRADNAEADGSTILEVLSKYEQWGVPPNPIVYTDPLNADPAFTVSAAGWVGVGLWETRCGDFAPTSRSIVMPHGSISTDWKFVTQLGPPVTLAIAADWSPGCTLSGTYYYAVQSFNADGTSHSLLSNIVNITVGGATNLCYMDWSDPTHAEKNWRVWRGTSSTLTEYINLPPGATDEFLDHGNFTWTAGSPSDTSTGYSSKVSSTQLSWLPKGLHLKDQVQISSQTGNVLEVRPSGIIGLSPGTGYEQFSGAPLYRVTQGDQVFAGDSIYREDFYYLQALAGWPEIAEYRIDHKKQYITYTGSDIPPGTLRNRFQFDLYNGEFSIFSAGALSGFATGGILNLKGSYEDYIRLLSSVGGLNLTYGFNSSGFYYGDFSIVGFIPYLVDTSTGFTGIGAPNTTTPIGGTLHLWDVGTGAPVLKLESDAGYGNTHYHFYHNSSSPFNNNFVTLVGSLTGYYPLIIDTATGMSGMGSPSLTTAMDATLHLWPKGTTNAPLAIEHSTTPSSPVIGALYSQSSDDHFYHWADPYATGTPRWTKLPYQEDVMALGISNMGRRGFFKDPATAFSRNLGAVGIASSDNITISVGISHVIYGSEPYSSEWTILDIPASTGHILYSVANQASTTRWLAVGNGDATWNNLKGSTNDGTSWSGSTTATDTTLLDVDWHANSSRFISVGHRTADNFVSWVRSYWTGAVWSHTKYVGPGAGRMLDVAADPSSNIVVAVGRYDHTSQFKYFRSTDGGVSFASAVLFPGAGAANPYSAYLGGIVWDYYYDRFVAVSHGYQVWTSPDGNTWTLVWSGSPLVPGTDFSNKIFFAVVDGVPVYIITLYDCDLQFIFSFNLVDWYMGSPDVGGPQYGTGAPPAPGSTAFGRATYAGGRFVFAGNLNYSPDPSPAHFAYTSFLEQRPF